MRNVGSTKRKKTKTAIEKQVIGTNRCVLEGIFALVHLLGLTLPCYLNFTIFPVTISHFPCLCLALIDFKCTTSKAGLSKATIVAMKLHCRVFQTSFLV